MLKKKLAINEAVQKVQKERDSLENDVKTKDLEKQSLENSLKQQFSNELKTKDEIIKYKDEEIARVKEMKQRLSTKMLGESLEQHCEREFNKLRSTAFQRAYFEKENEEFKLINNFDYFSPAISAEINLWKYVTLELGIQYRYIFKASQKVSDNNVEYMFHLFIGNF